MNSVAFVSPAMAIQNAVERRLDLDVLNRRLPAHAAQPAALPVDVEITHAVVGISPARELDTPRYEYAVISGGSKRDILDSREARRRRNRPVYKKSLRDHREGANVR